MCLSNLVFLSPLNFSSPPNFHENMHDFRSPSFFQGRRLRPCFNGVDAPGRRTASRRALPCTSSFCLWTKVYHVPWKSLVRIFSLAPKLSGLRRCILNQILNFHDYFLGGETPSQLWCALSSLGQSLARVKIWRGSTP